MLQLRHVDFLYADNVIDQIIFIFGRKFDCDAVHGKRLLSFARNLLNDILFDAFPAVVSHAEAIKQAVERDFTKLSLA